MTYYHGPDVFKKYPLRFAGYGFGLAEALSGSVTFPVVNGLRVMATGFIFAHTVYKPVQVAKRGSSSLKVVTSAADTFVYEAVVSGIIPPAVAHAMKRLVVSLPIPKSVPGPTRAWLPAGVAVASLPIVMPPCDGIVDILMDATIRRLYP